MSPEEDEARAQHRAFSRRAVLLGLGQAVVLAALGTRLYQLQVFDAGRYAPLADDNRINTLALAPLRGRIVDRFGTPLADSTEAFRASIVPSLVDDLPAALDRLGRLLPIDEEA